MDREYSFTLLVKQKPENLGIGFDHFSSNSYNWNQKNNRTARLLWKFVTYEVCPAKIRPNHALGEQILLHLWARLQLGRVRRSRNRWWCAKFKFKLLAKKLLTPVVRDRQISSVVVVWWWAHAITLKIVFVSFFSLPFVENFSRTRQRSRFFSSSISNVPCEWNFRG